MSRELPMYFTGDKRRLTQEEREELGLKIRNSRKVRELSQHGLARESGMSELLHIMTRIERGSVEPSAPTLMRFAEVLGVNVMSLISEDALQRLGETGDSFRQRGIDFGQMSKDETKEDLPAMLEIVEENSVNEEAVNNVVYYERIDAEESEDMKEFENGSKNNVDYASDNSSENTDHSKDFYNGGDVEMVSAGLNDALYMSVENYWNQKPKSEQIAYLSRAILKDKSEEEKLVFVLRYGERYGEEYVKAYAAKLLSEEKYSECVRVVNLLNKVMAAKVA